MKRMRKIYYILAALMILGLMEGIVWIILKPSGEEPSLDSKTQDRTETQPPSGFSSPREETKPEELLSVSDDPADTPYSSLRNTDPGSFPPPTTEVVNGRTERTIHIGVRQYVWEPATLTANKGELVRLIVHNADVKHGLVIPDLGVYQDIPPEGAVVEFTPEKRGTFEFFCSVWCGEGHMEMQGKITVE